MTSKSTPGERQRLQASRAPVPRIRRAQRRVLPSDVEHDQHLLSAGGSSDPQADRGGQAEHDRTHTRASAYSHKRENSLFHSKDLAPKDLAVAAGKP